MLSGLVFGLLNAKAQTPVANFSATPTTGCGPLNVTFTDQSSNSPTAWTWDFGNGQISSRQNPVITYSNPGTYNVRLIVRNASGSDVVEKDGYITVYASPHPLLTSNLSVACVPANVQFTDNSVPEAGTITSWLWTFGDGSTSTVQNPLHVYNQTGYFNIGLQVTNSGGCSASIVDYRYIRVVNGVQPNFVFNQSSASCTAPYTGQLLNQSAGPGNLTYAWTIGNGATPSSSPDTSPVVTFPSNGQYNVNLAVVSSLGCSATIQQAVNLTGRTITINGPTTACVNAPVTFTDGSNPPASSSVWSFSDGSTSNGGSVTRSFPSTGTYTVNLADNFTSCSATGTATINIVNPATANFAASPTAACKPPLTVQFSDQSSPAANVTGWLWDFGDGSTSTQQNPAHPYTTSGNFNVTLTATGGSGCSNSVTKNAFVTIQAPTVTIGGVLTGCIASTATFNSVSPAAILTAVDAPQSYAWKAPGSNEGTSSSADPTFSYPSVGSYTISVTVTTTGGCQATASTTVNIGIPLAGQPPSFTFTPASPVCNNTLITFTASPAGETQYLWNFGDHTATVQGTTTTATHQYSFYGAHTVSLLVYNGACPQQATQIIQINPPFAGFSFGAVKPIDCANESAIQFTDTSFVGAAGTYGGPTWSWDFGDGTSSTLESPVHTYPSANGTPQQYTVTLTVSQGTCTSTAQQTVTIAKVVPSFTMPATACHLTPITITSTSTPASLDSIYEWRFDGTGPYSRPYTSPTVDTIVRTNGNHTVSLIVYDINNCPSTPVTHNITITGPHANYTAPAGGCANAPVTFTDHSTPDPDPIIKWRWDYDDGTPRPVYPTSGPFTHPYTDTGTYTPVYTVFDANGCSDAWEQQLQITSPTANFFPPDSFYCPNALETFIDSSQGYNLTETWNFGDGSPTSMAGAHTYTNNGTYNVSLTVTDKNACISPLTTKPIRIQTPIAAFNIYDTTAICLPLQTIFAAHGQNYDSLYWNFGDGTTSTLDSTSHFYNNFGIDTAKLFLEGPGGCLDSASYRVRISNPATTTLNYGPPLSECDSLPTNFIVSVPPYALFTLNFGDGSADSTQSTTPFHMYRNPSQYFPSLLLSDETGCIYYFSTNVGVTVLGATPYFNVNQDKFCDSGIVKFTDYTISNDGFATETYLFGDGSPDESQTGGIGGFNTSHDYGQTGNWPATLQVVTHDGCKEAYIDTIRIYQTPHPAITNPATTCAGALQFQGSTTPPQIDSILWNWNFGNGQTSKVQNPTVPMVPGTYKVTLDASVPFGCIDSASSSITINPSPVVTGPHELTVPLGIPVTIPFTYSSDVVSYQWTPTSNLSCTDCANPVATVILATTYTVTVTDANTCSGSDTILIKTVCNDKNYWFPNTFSPNGDGVNDYFYPRGTSLYNIQSLTIFNRWGQQVFARMNFPANQQNMGWDGTFGGKPAPADAYVYIAEVICENAQVITISGNVTLIR